MNGTNCQMIVLMAFLSTCHLELVVWDGNLVKYVILAGDLNLLAINWDNLCATNQQTAAKHNKLIEIVGEFGLVNMVNEPTQLDSGNILDLVLTSNPSLISTINTVAGMSDHEAILRKNKPPHKVYNYRSANWESLEVKCTQLAQQYFIRKPDEQELKLELFIKKLH